MEEIINKIADCLKEVSSLKYELDDKDYWIDKAAKETGFIPREGDWIHVEVTIWKIAVSVHHDKHVIGENRYWINGEWFDTPFPKKYPNL